MYDIIWQGYVPRKEMSTEEILYPDKVFYLGQVVRCAIKSWYSQDRRLILTLKVVHLRKHVAVYKWFNTRDSSRHY